MKKDKMFSSLPKYDAGGRVKKYMGGGMLHNNMMNRMGMYKDGGEVVKDSYLTEYMYGGKVGKKLSDNTVNMHHNKNEEINERIKRIVAQQLMGSGGKVKKNKKY